jgi:tRNA-specific 2-thiouridylase
VPEACLERTVFPLGDLEKNDVRQVARQAHLSIAEKAESQEICFLPDGGRDDFLAEHGNPQPGLVRDLEGNVVGQHAGIGNYTVGQRRGLNVAMGRPMYVHHIEPGTHTVVIGDDASLSSAGVVLDDAWLRGDPEPRDCQVQVRYRSRPVAVADWTWQGETLVLQFDAPVRAVAPGQTAVLYAGDRVVGGGRIRSVV